MNKKNFLRYVYAILAVPLIILLRFSLLPLIGPGIPYVTLFPVSVVVALLAGMGPAILTGILGSLAIDYFFIPPLHSIEFNIPGISRAAVVILTSAFVGYVGDMLRAARTKAEQQAIELHASQADLNRAQAVAHSGSWRLDVRQDKLTWSDESYRIFGVPSGTELAYESFLSYIHPDDKKYVDTKWKAALAGEKYDVEHRIVVDGQIKWVRERAELEFDKDGALLGGFGTVTDITARKEAEAILLREKNFSDTTIDSLPGVFYLFNEQGRFLRWNKNFEKVLGFTPEEMSKTNPVDLFAGDDKRLIAERIKEVLVKGKSSAEAKLISKSGTAIAYFFTGNRVIFDGKPCLVGMGIDISQRKQMEEELRKSHDELEVRVKERTTDLDEAVSDLQKQVQQIIKAEETIKAERKRLENVLEMMPAYAVLLTPDYHVAYANRTFRDWFGDDNGRKCYEFLFNRKEPCENCETYNVMKTGKSQFWEWTGPNSHNYDIYDYPFTDTDGSPLIMEIGVDVTAHKQTQTALRSTSLYARGLLEASLDPLVTISPEGKITDINRATELVTGLSREGLIGSDFSDYFTEPQKAKDGYKKVIAEGMVKDYPLTIRHISGHTTDVLYNATLYKNEAGQVQGIFAAARDITERKSAEEKQGVTNSLLELYAKKTTRKEYLDSVVNAIRDWSGCQCVGIRLTNSDGLIPYESQIGFTKDFLAIESVLSLKTDTCACMRVITQKPEPQDALVMTSKGSFRCDNTFEFFNSLPEKKKARYRGHCIRHGFASLAVVPIRYRDKVLGAVHVADKKENKTPAQTVEFIENIAMLIGEAVHRFDIETELRESEERYRQLVELSPEGIGVERDDEIVFINTAAVRLLGAKSSAELIGKPILDFVYPEYRKRTHMQLEFLRRKRKALPLRENIFLRVDGTPMDVEVAATPLAYENRPAAQIVFRDITERKLAQERIISDQKQLRLLTAELLLTEERERHEIATALHDSLGPILAFSKRELGTLQKSAPPHIAETLKNVSDNISQAVKQTRTLTFDLSPPTLYTLGFEIATEELLERFCQEHKLEYSFQNSDAPKPLTDPVKVLLYRSIREMLINIAKHARAKLVKVVLSRADNDIEVIIEDDGRGFDVSALKEKSKGLGLFSVRERLRHIGGKLEIESKRGKGTHITLTVPLKIG